MSDAKHARAKEIFLQAIELAVEEREAYINRSCGEDSELRRTVARLLEHHSSTSIIEERQLAAQPAGYQTTTQRRLSGLYEHARQRRWWTLVGAALLVALGLWAHARVEDSLLRIREGELNTVLRAEVQALRLWIQDRQGQAELLASDPRVVSAVRELLAIGETTDSKLVIDAWERSPATQTLIRICDKFAEMTDNTGGVGVLDERGILIFVHAGDETGNKVNPTGFAYLLEALEGRTKFMRPYRNSEISNAVDSGTMYTIVFTPVFDDGQDVIAVLVAAQRAYGPGSMSRILEVAQLGTTGETYAFDDRGIMLTESRFTEELRRAGLAPALDESRSWDGGSQLNVQVRDPGGDLLRGHEPELELEARPLTRLAAIAIAAHDEPEDAERRGVLLTPYRNYRGVEVLGAWQWVPEHGIGVATEIESDEALAPLRYLNVTFGVLFLVLSGFVAATFLSMISVARLRRRIHELKELGPYRLLSSLGEGGMGTVYLAEHALLKRKTAVKILSGDGSGESINRFEREVRLSSQLTHPNTIEIFDFGRTPEGTLYYAMEYIEGPTLAELVERHGPLPPERTVHILKQICASLGEAHRMGLIHRDVKPQNVMLCQRGGDTDVVKVLDFGLVMDLSTARPDGLTGTRLAGTPLYMAPERLLAEGPVDARVDLYSLGALAHYLLTGRPVFAAAGAAELIIKVVNEVPEPLSSSAPDLDALVAECLAKDPENRPQSVFVISERLSALSNVDLWTQDDATEWWEQHRTDPPSREQAAVDTT